MNLIYWCPFLSKVATVRAVLNSAISVKQYSKNKLNPQIINSVGEWNEFKDIIENNVGVYKNQSLVIINKGGATGSDIYNFSQKIKQEVKNKFDILLEEEVNII